MSRVSVGLCITVTEEERREVIRMKNIANSRRWREKFYKHDGWVVKHLH
jgi:hypothetical protein